MQALNYYEKFVSCLFLIRTLFPSHGSGVFSTGATGAIAPAILRKRLIAPAILNLSQECHGKFEPGKAQFFGLVVSYKCVSFRNVYFTSQESRTNFLDFFSIQKLLLTLKSVLSHKGFNVKSNPLDLIFQGKIISLYLILQKSYYIFMLRQFHKNNN